MQLRDLTYLMNHSYFHYGNSIEIYGSIICSFVLFLGNSVLGRMIFARELNRVCDNQKYRFVHYPLLGNMIMNAMIHIGIAFSLPIPIVVLIIGIGTILLGIYGGYMLTRKIWNERALLEKINSGFKSNTILAMLLVGFFLLALAPITNADALDYHIGVPIWMLKHEKVLWQPTWFHQGMAGIGENSILVSVAFNAEQFATLVQYSGLLSLVGLFFSFNSINKHPNQTSRSVFSILLLSTPVLLFLGSTPKPQLTGIALTSLVFCLLVHRKFSFKDLDIRKIIGLIFILTYVVLLKLNFAFSASILFILFIMDVLAKRQNIKINWAYIVYGISIAFVLLILPLIIIRNSAWGNDILHYLHPIPRTYPGFENFMIYLTRYQDNPFPFPITLFIPKTLGQISMILGVNLVLLISIFFMAKMRNRRHLIPIAILCLCTYFFSQHSARFYYEPMVWLCLYFYANTTFDIKNERILLKIISVLGTFQLLFLSFGVVSLTKGILSVSSRREVLEKSANGYALSEWVNHQLPAESNVLSSHRSTALFKQHVYKGEWMNYIGKDSVKKVFYEAYLKKQHIDYVVLSGEDPTQSPLFPYCNKLIAGPFEFKRETRNPMNRSSSIKAWIYSSNLH